MAIRLITLGGLQVVADGGAEPLLGRRLRAALCVYLAVERRATRAELAALFWPERDEAQARHALRQALYDLRKVLGAGWIEATAHDVRVHPDVRTDIQTFTAALERGAAEAAAKLYGGAFLQGLHLADQHAWENWVDLRRTEYARSFRRACREWCDARCAAGDVAGAFDAAQRWVAPDPYDDEAQHRLIDLLAGAGERAAAVRQYEAYARMLEADGLRPLDETIALVARLRAHKPSFASHPIELDPSRLPAAASGPGSTGAGTAARRHRPSWVAIAGGVAAALLVAFAAALEHQRAGAPAVAVARTGLDRIVLADFGGPTADPALGPAVTEALRMDLVRSGVVHVLDRAEVRAALARMRATGEPLTAALAREVALREGVKAVLAGDVAPAGSGFVLTAALRSAGSDSTLAAFRESAAGPDDVIPAIDRLSHQVQRHAGQSLRSLGAAAPLARVTSASLDALRVYGEAERAFLRTDYPRAIVLLDEALALDPDFAMAWRTLAVTLGNSGRDRIREMEAATRAYELRHRLPPRERYLAAARYHAHVANDRDAAIAAYQRLLHLDPDDYTALNNLGTIRRATGDFDLAADLFARVVDRPDPPPAAWLNLVLTRLAQGRFDAARATTAALSARYPAHRAAAEARFWVRVHDNENAAIAAELEPIAADPTRDPRDRAWAHDRLARLDLRHGRVAGARRHLEAAERVVTDAGLPSNPFAWRLSRAFAEAMAGDPDRGAELLLRSDFGHLLDTTPPADRLHGIHATILALGGRTAEAEAVLRRFADDVPEELQRAPASDVAAVRAVLLILRGRPEEAVRLLEQARAASRCRFCYADRMGWALRDAGRLADAAHEWEAVLSGSDVLLDTGFQLAQQSWVSRRLPALYETLGDAAAALIHYRRIVELWSDADAELQPIVAHARARIAALTEE